MNYIHSKILTYGVIALSCGSSMFVECKEYVGPSEEILSHYIENTSSTTPELATDTHSQQNEISTLTVEAETTEAKDPITISFSPGVQSETSKSTEMTSEVVVQPEKEPIANSSFIDENKPISTIQDFIGVENKEQPIQEIDTSTVVLPEIPLIVETIAEELTEAPPSLEYVFEKKMLSIEERITKALEEPGALLFTPPEGWGAADPNILSPRVKVMVVGKGKTEYPPSIHLGMEPYKGTVKEYLKMIRVINDSQGDEFKDLGKIRTQAGDASLCQVDMRTEWGTVRLMHVILKKNEQLYVLTAAAKKDEFPQFYRDFFQSMRSLRFNKDVMEMVTSPKRKRDLQKACDELSKGWRTLCTSTERPSHGPLSKEEFYRKLFESPEFQSKYWVPFKDVMKKQFGDLGENWRQHFLAKMEQDLIDHAS